MGSETVKILSEEMGSIKGGLQKIIDNGCKGDSSCIILSYIYVLLLDSK